MTELTRYLLAARVGIALISSGILAYSSQIAVFIYTRVANAPIPAGEIIGFSFTASSAVLSALWFGVFLVLALFQARKEPSDATREIDGDDSVDPAIPQVRLRENCWDQIRRHLRGIWIALALAFFLMLCPPVTAKLLGFLGYGGGEMGVCPGQSTGIGPGKLILLTDQAAYIQRSGKGYTRVSLDGLSVLCDTNASESDPAGIT